MDRFDKEFLNLVDKVKEDAIKVLDDSLTYIIAALSINPELDVRWDNSLEQTMAYHDFMYFYLDFMQDSLGRDFWCDAWGNMFMENSGNFKSFRGQFFTPEGVSDLCAMVSMSESIHSGRRIINDCACGSARMLLAANKQAYERHEGQPYLIGEDIDGICCKMAAVNMAVHGCLGEVIRHDSLREPGEFRYGYLINETLASGCGFPSIRYSADRADFWKLRNTTLPAAEYKQLALFQ